MTATIGETAVIAHGWTMADLDRLARFACSRGRNRSSHVDADERWDAVWFSMVETLYTSVEKPSANDLLDAAQSYVNAVTRQAQRSRGLGTVDSLRRGEPGANFVRYWRHFEEPDDGFTDRIVERIALREILSLLTAREYEALAAQAIYEDGKLAAQSMGVTYATFTTRLRRARRKLIAAWFDTETPPIRTWGDPLRCRYGHARDEHGYVDLAGNTQCRICRRNEMRRRSARKR